MGFSGQVRTRSCGMANGWGTICALATERPCGAYSSWNSFLLRQAQIGRGTVAEQKWQRVAGRQILAVGWRAWPALSMCTVSLMKLAFPHLSSFC